MGDRKAGDQHQPPSENDWDFDRRAAIQTVGAQLPYMCHANARAVRNRARYVRDGAGSLDWGLPRTRHNGDVARVGRPIPQGTTGVLEEEQYLRGQWAQAG